MGGVLPCALLLATPVPHAAALANGQRGRSFVAEMRWSGWLTNHILLDKTGTLTSVNPNLNWLSAKVAENSPLCR